MADGIDIESSPEDKFKLKRKRKRRGLLRKITCKVNIVWSLIAFVLYGYIMYLSFRCQ